MIKAVRFLIFFIISFPVFAEKQTNEDKLDRKIGQMIMVGFRGNELTEKDSIVQQIRQGIVGGVILYEQEPLLKSHERNILSPEQLENLTTFLQAQTKKTLLIAIDQEGGKVSRLNPTKGFPESLSAKTLGNLNRLNITRGVSEVTASTLKKAGINLNLAPVVDLDYSDNPIISQKERSFSNDPEIVYSHAKEVIIGHKQHGILTAIKHFPGMGSAKADTHLGFVDTSCYWSEEELVPFQKLINDKLVPIVLVGHTWNNQFDAIYPASLSKETIHELLRETIGFKGVIMTDDLQMRALRDHYDFETIIERALIAGVDILLFSNSLIYDEEIAPKAIQVIKNLIAKGTITEKRILKSVKKIRELKEVLRKNKEHK